MWLSLWDELVSICYSKQPNVHFLFDHCWENLFVIFLAFKISVMETAVQGGNSTKYHWTVPLEIWTTCLIAPVSLLQWWWFCRAVSWWCFSSTWTPWASSSTRWTLFRIWRISLTADCAFEVFGAILTLGGYGFAFGIGPRITYPDQKTLVRWLILFGCT